MPQPNVTPELETVIVQAERQPGPRARAYAGCNLEARLCLDDHGGIVFAINTGICAYDYHIMLDSL